MVDDSIRTGMAELTRLDWDSKEFGFPVAIVAGSVTGEDELKGLLLQARDDGFALVYFFSSSDARVSDAIQTRFQGRLVAKRAIFEKTLDPVANQAVADEDLSFRIEEYPQGPASEELKRLSLEAGLESRFRVDPKFPRTLFEHLYYTWIERSTKHEAADAVFVAKDAQGRLIGFVTVVSEQDHGKVGLIAVVDPFRGRGVGRRLLQRAETWMATKNLQTAEIVTQVENQTACRFYERRGYHLIKIEHIYHFWPQSPNTMASAKDSAH